MQALASQSSYKVCSRGAQASVNILLEVMGSIMQGTAPTWPRCGATTFMMLVKERSLWYATWATPSTEGCEDDGGDMVRGRAAVAATLKYLEDAFETGD